MIILAWIHVVLGAISLFLLPLAWGCRRKPIGVAVFYETILRVALTIPLCGRILGWW